MPSSHNNRFQNIVATSVRQSARRRRNNLIKVIYSLHFIVDQNDQTAFRPNSVDFFHEVLLYFYSNAKQRVFFFFFVIRVHK